MKILKPDYDQSLLSLMSSILNYYGVKDADHPTLKEADELLNKNYKNVVLCLFDGMGYLNLEEHKDDAPFLYEHVLRPLSSVFPPTTVAATTTVLSGKSPAQSAWLGWDMYFEELGHNVDVFINKIQFTKDDVCEYNYAFKHLAYDTIFKRINDADKDVTTNYISDFGDIQYKENLNTAKKLLLEINKREGRQFTYFYNVYPDETMHQTGTMSKSACEWFKKLDKFVKEFSEKADDTLIMVIADHGHIDIDWIYLDEYPEIHNMLLREPSIETRSASLFIKDEYKDVFEEKFNEVLGDKFMLMSKMEILDTKLFGPGKMHERTEGFIGDYLAIAIDKYAMGITRIEENLKSHHAGMTEKEMLIPLVVIEK